MPQLPCVAHRSPHSGHMSSQMYSTSSHHAADQGISFYVFSEAALTAPRMLSHTARGPRTSGCVQNSPQHNFICSILARCPYVAPSCYSSGSVSTTPLPHTLLYSMSNPQLQWVVDYIHAILDGGVVGRLIHGDFYALTNHIPHGPISNARPLRTLITVLTLEADHSFHYLPFLCQREVIPPTHFALSAPSICYGFCMIALGVGGRMHGKQSSSLITFAVPMI